MYSSLRNEGSQFKDFDYTTVIKGRTMYKPISTNL